MTEPAGRRAASKQATREALLAAASRLFAERGFDGTTVRDIAAAADVTERTFYRYFDGKEGLIAGEFRAWLTLLHEAIVARPPEEAPAAAVHRVMAELGRWAAAGSGPLPLWMFSPGPPLRGLRKAAPRPLLQLESAISDAILARGWHDGQAGAPPAGTEFSAQVISRVTVAAFRSAMIRYRELRASGATAPRLQQELLDEAFAVVTRQWQGRAS